MKITVFLPKHSSALCHPPETEGRTTSQDKHKIIQLHVHRERAMWNIFAPIFDSSNTIGILASNEHVSLDTRHKAELLLQVLIDKMLPGVSLACHSPKYDIMDSCHESGNNNLIDEEENKILWSRSTFTMKCKKRKRKQNEYLNLFEESRNNPISLIIYIIPPMPILSYNPNIQPERIFTSSLVRLENLQIKLQSLNAYIATLGGGYFLCHYLSTAVCLARYQRKIALQLNDVNLALKCTINEAYNFIHAGMIRRALDLIQKTQDIAESRKKCHSRGDDGEDDIIISMCQAAKWFAECVRNHGKNSLNSNNKGNLPLKRLNRGSVTNDLQSNNDQISATHDDYQRIRIIRNRIVAHEKKSLSAKNA